MVSGLDSRAEPVERRPLRRRVSWLDVVAVTALGLVAVLLRRDFATDGLFYDDAWQALGVVRGSLGDLPLIGQTQPGFTLELLAWTSLAGTSDVALVMPTLIAGVLGAPALYLVLRCCGFVRAIAVLLATALAVAPAHIMYSTRVKSYTADVLVMLMITLILPRLARLRWGPPVAAAWVGGSILAATYSSFAVLGMAGAGLILVLHPNGDRRLRVVAVGTQAVAQAVFLAAVSQQANTRLITGFFRTRGGFIEVTANPVETAGNVLDHLVRVVSVYPGLGGPRWLLIGLVAAAVAGLVAAAWRGPLAIRGRFLGLTVLMAMAGSFLRLVPFGAETGRVTLWMIPAVAVGLATSIDWLRRPVANHALLGRGVEAGALALAVLTLATAGDHSTAYPPAGARDGTHYVIERLEDRDAVWITRPTTFSFALYAGLPVELEPTPKRSIGFLPDFQAPRLVVIPDFRPDLQSLDRSLADADRVWIVDADVKPNGTGPPAELRRRLAQHLEAAGFQLERPLVLGATNVSLWRRTPT